MAARRKSKGERSRRRSPERAQPAATLATEEQPAMLATEESQAPLPSEELAVTEESRATAASTTGELPMNRDFEFQQLLRAYRAGIITEKTFEIEMAALEHGVGANGSNGTAGGFRAFGKNYASEREAVLTFLDMAQAAEANGAVIFDNWAKLCTTDCIRSGIKMVAERERYHARVFENRLHELGGQCSAPVTEEGRKFLESISNPKIKDTEKLLIHNKLVPDPAARFKSICEFAELIKEDLETKEMVKLFVEDEISSGNWLNSACAALNAPATSKPAAMNAMTE
jgi:rubrerythrin